MMPVANHQPMTGRVILLMSMGSDVRLHFVFDRLLQHPPSALPQNPIQNRTRGKLQRLGYSLHWRILLPVWEMVNFDQNTRVRRFY